MKVLMVDPFPVCREALSAIIVSRFGPCEFSYVESLQGLEQGVAHACPDVTLIDGNLCAAARNLVALCVARSAPRPVIVMHPHPDPGEAKWARGVGVRGFIPKTYPRELVDAALKVVVAGGAYFPFHASERSSMEGGHGRSLLTVRQRQVLDRIAAGLSNRRIAEELGIAVGTVKLHAHHAFAAIGVKNRTQAAVWARRNLGIWHASAETDEDKG